MRALAGENNMSGNAYDRTIFSEVDWPLRHLTHSELAYNRDGI